MVSSSSSPSSSCPHARFEKSAGQKFGLSLHQHPRSRLCARCGAPIVSFPSVGRVWRFGIVHPALPVGYGHVFHFPQCPCSSAREYHLDHRLHLCADAVFEWRELARKCHALVLENPRGSDSLHTSHQRICASFFDGRQSFGCGSRMVPPLVHNWCLYPHSMVGDMAQRKAENEFEKFPNKEMKDDWKLSS